MRAILLVSVVMVALAVAQGAHLRKKRSAGLPDAAIKALDQLNKATEDEREKRSMGVPEAALKALETAGAQIKKAVEGNRKKRSLELPEAAREALKNAQGQIKKAEGRRKKRATGLASTISKTFELASANIKKAVKAHRQTRSVADQKAFDMAQKVKEAVLSIKNFGEKRIKREPDALNLKKKLMDVGMAVNEAVVERSRGKRAVAETHVKTIMDKIKANVDLVRQKRSEMIETIAEREESKRKKRSVNDKEFADKMKDAAMQIQKAVMNLSKK